MDKSVKVGGIIKLIVWSVVLVTLVSLFGVMLTGNSFDFIKIGNISFLGGYIYDDSETYNVGDAEYSDAVHSLDISWIAGSVDIVVSDGDTIKLIESGASENDEDLMRSKVENGCLIVKFADSGVKLFGKQQPKALTVSIPASMCGSVQTLSVDSASSCLTVDGAYGDGNESVFSFDRIDVDTASGGVNVKCKSALEVDVDTTSGEVALNGDFGTVEVDAVSADVKIEGSANKLNLEAVSGSVYVDGEVVSSNIGTVSGAVVIKTYTSLPSSLEIETVSGSVELSLPDIESGFEARIDAVSGDMYFNGNKTGYYKHGSGVASYNFESVSGNVTINLRKQ